MTTTRSHAALLLAGLTAAGILTAPTAAARPTCQTDRSQTTCQTSGSVSIKSRPATIAPPGNLPQLSWRDRRLDAGIGAHGPAF